MTLLTLVVASFRRRSLRALLTVLGVAIAVGAFLAFRGMSAGLEGRWQGVYVRSGTDLLVAQDNVFTSAIDQRTAGIVAELPRVRAVAPLLFGLSSVDGNTGTPVTGWPADAYTLDGLTLQGRRFRNAAPEAMLGASVARRLGKTLGDQITIAGAPYTIVGIFRSPNILEMESVYVPLQYLQEVKGSPGIISSMHVAVDRGGENGTSANVTEAAAAITKRFPRLVVHRTEEFARENDIVRMARATSWATSVIALGVAALGVANTMSMAVLERTREIGLLRAVGWRRRRVLELLLWESVALTVSGGAVGILLGTAGLRALAAVPLTRLLANPVLETSIYVQAIVLAVILGIVGGMLPATRASRISPIEALRYE